MPARLIATILAAAVAGGLAAQDEPVVPLLKAELAGLAKEIAETEAARTKATKAGRTKEADALLGRGISLMNRERDLRTKLARLTATEPAGGPRRLASTGKASPEAIAAAGGWRGTEPDRAPGEMPFPLKEGVAGYLGGAAKVAAVMEGGALVIDYQFPYRLDAGRDGRPAVYKTAKCTFVVAGLESRAVSEGDQVSIPACIVTGTAKVGDSALHRLEPLPPPAIR